jgi:hypothetical protein
MGVSVQDASIALYSEKLGFSLYADVPYGDVERWVEVARAEEERRSRSSRARRVAHRAHDGNRIGLVRPASRPRRAREPAHGRRAPVLTYGGVVRLTLPTWIVLPFIYSGYMEGGPSGQTVGKRALNIRVVDFDTAGPIGVGRGSCGLWSASSRE